MPRANDDICLTPDDVDISVRRQAWDLIEKHFDGIIGGFYRMILGSRNAALLDAIDVDMLKAKQKDHWKKLFLASEPDNAAYYERIRRMYARHHEIGLDNTNYLSAYIYLLGGFHRAVLQGSPGPKQAHTLITAINAVVADDIARAVATQHGTLFID